MKAPKPIAVVDTNVVIYLLGDERGKDFFFFRFGRSYDSKSVDDELVGHSTRKKRKGLFREMRAKIKDLRKEGLERCPVPANHIRIEAEAIEASHPGFKGLGRGERDAIAQVKVLQETDPDNQYVFVAADKRALRLGKSLGLEAIRYEEIIEAG